MEDKDVDALLRMVGLRTTDRDTQYDFHREELIQRLMNITLQCLGTIRVLSVEAEKNRVAKDCCDIDGTNRDDGKESRLQREIFCNAVRTMNETIISSQDLDQHDPSKDLIESFPWSQSMTESGWLMLDWAIVDDGYAIRNDQDKDFHLHKVKNVIKHFPKSINEIDKKGQQYMSYAIRANSMELMDTLMQHNKKCVKMKDGTGKLPIHYCATHGQSIDQLYSIIEAMGKPIETIMTNCMDDNENLPLHCAAMGSCTPELLKEIMFANPEAVKAVNKEGKLPLHIAACNTDLEKVKMIFSAYPHAISVPDVNGWLPLYHAAFTCKSVEIVKFIHEKYPEAINKPHHSGRLPLHYAAVTCYSSKVMKYLIELYPDGVKTFDINRRLPIHNLIARCTYMTPSRLRCLRVLLEAYPHGASMAGKDGRTPLDLARRDNHGDLVLRLLLRADPEQDPEALGEISYLASQAKYKHRYESKE